MISPWKNSLDVIWAKGEPKKKKEVALLLSVSLSPQRKKEWITLTLTVSFPFSPLHLSVWWKKSYDHFDNKGPRCLCLDEALLSSLLPSPSLSISSKPVWSHLLSPSSVPTAPIPPLIHPPPPFSCSISCCLMPLSSFAPPFFVRASAIQSGYGIKNQKVSLSKRHPGWCTLMSPLKFEIHMLSHLILFPLSPSLTHSFSFFFFSPHLPPLLSVKCHHVLFSDEERNERNREMYKAL